MLSDFFDLMKWDPRDRHLCAIKYLLLSQLEVQGFS